MEAPPTSIILCANRLKDRAEMEEALVHELMHVYDVSPMVISHMYDVIPVRCESRVVSRLLQEARVRCESRTCCLDQHQP